MVVNGDPRMDRYVVDSSGGRGWAKVHVIVDRATVPHTVLSNKGRWHMGKRPTVVKACAELNEAAGPWTREVPLTDSLTRLRDWASRTKAFTEHELDPNADPAALVRPAALHRSRGDRLAA